VIANGKTDVDTYFARGPKVNAAPNSGEADSNDGFGKRSVINEYAGQSRGTQGK
jgi:hypothetical protein